MANISLATALESTHLSTYFQDDEQSRDYGRQAASYKVVRSVKAHVSMNVAWRVESALGECKSLGRDVGYAWKCGGLVLSMRHIRA